MGGQIGWATLVEPEDPPELRELRWRLATGEDGDENGSAGAPRPRRPSSA
jgi:hypothetical protein